MGRKRYGINNKIAHFKIIKLTVKEPEILGYNRSEKVATTSFKTGRQYFSRCIFGYVHRTSHM
ncbi:MAG: hypothetical protein IJS61_07765 [Firmicutes bacterium]|nr:hypothetical protein [Bacillota bacterium]